MVDELNAAKRLILKYFGLGIGILMHIPGLKGRTSQRSQETSKVNWKRHLPIRDDFGLQPLNADIRMALLQILEDGYQRKTTLISSQIPVAQSHAYIGDPTLADAILDRLPPNSQK